MFPWIWKGYRFESKAGLRRTLRGQVNIGRIKGVRECVDSACKAGIINNDERAELLKEFKL